MKTIYQKLMEDAYNNIISPEDKSKVADEVWDIMTDSYEYAGGFKTFKSKQDMIDKSWMWKINKIDGEILAVVIYKKDQYGNRKSVASAINKNATDYKKSIEIYTETKLADITRSYMEVSGKLESIIMKNNMSDFKISIEDLPEQITKHIIPVDKFNEKVYNNIENIQDFKPNDYDSILKIISDDYHYIKKIGNKYFIKSCYGTFQKIY